MVHISRKQASANRPRPGLQARSRESFERVLIAAEDLLKTRLFEQVGMTEIAERAGIAVGTVYQRFPSKEALVPALFERHNAAVGGRVMQLARDLGAEPSLRQRVRLLVTFSVEYHVGYRGLLRALTTFVRANPHAVEESLFAEREALYTAIARMLVGDEHEIPHANPVESALFTLGVINSVCREQILFGDVSPLSRRRAQADAFVDRLVAMVERDLMTTLPTLPT